jgi:hypothetical protein
MKILKYIFLLLLLSFISFSVFIVTQKGTFKVEKSKYIKATRTTAFSYVNDFQNWADFMVFIDEEKSVQSRYSKKSINQNAQYSWIGTENSGWVETNSFQENSRIDQKMNIEGSEYTITWIFKDTLGGTKVTLKSEGEMSFSYKIYNALNGGAGKIIGNLFEKSLFNLDKNLDYEINTYKIIIKGLVQKTGTPYLKQTFTSKINSILKNSKIVFPKLIAFCDQNQIERNGKPFIIYHTYDTKNGLAKISLCVPIKQAIMTSYGSDILADELAPFKAIKTTLYGDYSHTKEALKKSNAYINQKVITKDSDFSHLEVFSIGKSESKYPSKWKTEIYFPIRSKKSTPKVEVKTEETSPIESEINSSTI